MKPSNTTEENAQLHNDIIFLFTDLLTPFMNIERDLPYPGNSAKRETDAEHVFSLSMIVLSIEERLALGLDRGLLAQYALIHDLVEAYAGDVSAKAAEHLQKQKSIDEAKALADIQNKYKNVFPWIGTLCQSYENKIDAESRFVYVIDKLMGAYTWLAGDLDGWLHYYPKEAPELLEDTMNRLRTKVNDQNRDYLYLFESLYDMLLAKTEEKELR